MLQGSAITELAIAVASEVAIIETLIVKFANLVMLVLHPEPIVLVNPSKTQNKSNTIILKDLVKTQKSLIVVRRDRE